MTPIREENLQNIQKRNRAFATNSNLLTPISMHPDGVRSTLIFQTYIIR